ncbi:TPA: ORF6N domain-containing protein [Escherichia coli]
MKTLPTVNTLQPILHNQLPVITTELLAKLYGTDVDNIKKNYSRNANRFIERKHFFKVAGDELKTLRVTLSHSQNLRVALNYSQNTISPKTRTLILWTERGAARHAKMLETDQAWDVFERLEDCYFNQNAKTAATVTVSPNNAREVVDTLNAKPMFYIKVCNNEPLTTSADVAQAFSTTNNSIVMAIDALRIPRTAAARHFFKEQRPLEGSDREITIYRMTKDGFTLLMESIDGPGVKDIE